MVGIAILMVLLDRLLVSTGQVEYHSVDLGYLVIDLIGSAATIALALLAHRFCPMIVAVLHVLPLLAHISRALDVSMRSEETTSELQSLMRTSYPVFCLTKKTNTPYH